jgi:hypothetical protein
MAMADKGLPAGFRPANTPHDRIKAPRSVLAITRRLGYNARLMPETIGYDDYIAHGGEQGAKDAGGMARVRHGWSSSTLSCAQTWKSSTLV